MSDFNPNDWYWFVAGDETQVYSSRTGDYVPLSNPSFVAWSGEGRAPSRIADEDELAEVLANNSARPSRAAMLDRYKDRQARTLTLKVVAKVLFHLANEIRALKGQQPITPQQFRGWLKDLM